MKDHENIEDWYRKELDDYHVDPDKGGWEALSSSLDNGVPLTDDNIGEWYKQEVHKLEEQPNMEVWKKLATTLDTSSVWDKLLVSLGRYEQMIWWRNIILRGTGLLLLGLGGYFLYDDLGTGSKQLSDSPEYVGKQEVAVFKRTGDASRISEGNLGGNVEQNSIKHGFTADVADEVVVDASTKQSIVSARAFYTSKSDLSQQKMEAKGNGKMTEFGTTENVDENILIAENTSSNRGNLFYRPFSDWEGLGNCGGSRNILSDFSRTHLSEKDIISSYAGELFLVKKKKNKIIFNNKRFSGHFAFGIYARRIYAGLNAEVKNQLVFAQLHSNHILGQYTAKTLLDVGSSVGATVGIIMSDKINVETNINVSSSAGYRKAYTFENNVFEESVTMNYTTISLLGKYMNNKSTFDNKKYSSNILFGVYGGYLNAASVNLSGSNISNVGEPGDVKAQYKNYDGGILVGIEQDRYLSKSWVITPGVRYHQGLINTSLGNDALSSSFNASLSFNLGVKYIFLKKG